LLFIYFLIFTDDEQDFSKSEKKIDHYFYIILEIKKNK